MAKQEVVFSLDVEASGPIPGPWWLCSFGVCRTDDVQVGIRRLLQPLETPLSRPDDPAAMEVVCQGLPGLRWSELGETPAARALALKAWFAREGLPARQALEELRAWLREQAGEDRMILMGSPVTFDFMWLYWYWWHLLEEMPPFGFSGLDLRSYFMGAHGVGFLGTGKQRYLKHYPNDLRHTHDPLDDARQQGRLWHDMVAARRQRGKLRPPG